MYKRQGLQYLAVYETEPVESRLDIYWETSTSGRIDQLNEQVEATGGQTIFSTQNFNFEFNEYWGIYDPTTPWDPTVQGSPEPGGGGGIVPSPSNGQAGRFRSVICGPFWFEDNVFQEIQDITVVSFTVTDAAGANVTADFDLLQIKGTGSTPVGPGNYVDYNGNTTTTYTWDTFLIVNKSYRLWQTTTPNIQEFDFEIQVTDDSFPGPPPAPIKTFTYTPLANGTILTDLPTINVGGRSFGSLPAQWGQNPSATPTAPPIIDYAKVCPPSVVIVDYGILGTIVEFYGMNGANYGNPASVPASNNQVGLQWTIDTINQGGVPAPGIFQLDSVTGVLTEVSPGTASGRYDIRIKVTGPDGTFDLCLFALIVGVPQADGSFSDCNSSMGANSVILFYDEAYVLSLHNNQTDAFAQMTNASFGFPNIWPSVTSILGSSLTGSSNAACNNYTPSTSSFDNILLREQIPYGGGGTVGALTQGTGYIWLDCELPGFYGTLGQYNSCDLSMAIEFRPTPTSNWEAAYDIEGQYLSFNSLVSNNVTNPWHSDTTVVGQSANNSFSNDYDQQGGCVTPFIGGVGSPSNNHNRVVSQNKTSTSGPSGFARISKLIAVGNSPTYGIPGAFGEYRVIIQSIGGNCFSCQGCGSSGPQSVKAGNSVIGEITFGDFFYSLGPQRAFAYRLNQTLTVGPGGALTTTSHPVQVYAREPVHRYVSTFFTDPTLTTPYTSYITSTGATYVSYIAAPTAGAGYTTPLNAGTSTSSNMTFARAAEGAATNNASPSTTQNLRVWAKNVNPATGTFIAGTAVPNSN